MGWQRVFGISALTAIAGLIASAVAGNLASGWYDFYAFEGSIELFVMMIALAGSIAGALVGLALSLILNAASRFDTWKLSGISTGTMLLLVVASTGIGRLLADIPPKIDGESLYLSVELRAPAGHASPASMPGYGYINLQATGMRGVRTQRKGPLFTDAARLVDGRWIIPAVAPIFTSRGGRRVEAGVGRTPLASFVLPLPAHPSARSREWSQWLPQLNDGKPLADQFTYRYKVVRQSEPLRVESVGRLTVETFVNSFHKAYPAYPVERASASSHFRIIYNGQDLRGFDKVRGVAVLNVPPAGGGTAPAALLVHAAQYSDATCHLMVDDGTGLVVRPFGTCQAPIAGRPLTSDPHRFASARDAIWTEGWVDRQTFLTPGLYEVDENVLDTRSLTIARIDRPRGAAPRGLPPPLGLSPDERSFVWFLHTASVEQPLLGVTEWKTNRSYEVPIDRDRMRFIGFETLDPAWVAHHFTWQRGPDGVDVLKQRPDFVPLPYRGHLTDKGYLLIPAGEALLNEVVRILVEELHAERLSDTPDGRKRIRLDGKLVYVSLGINDLAVTMDFGKWDAQLIRRMGTHLDAAFATGKYDALFRVSPSRGS